MLNPVVFIIPSIALTLVIILFALQLKKIIARNFFKRYIVLLIILAFLLNYAWEIVQIPLYTNAPVNIAHIAFCGLATVADVVMVLLMYLISALIFNDPLWIRKFSLPRFLFIFFIGGIGAIAAETRHLHLKTWAYTSYMPIIPVFHVGLSPVLQFMILPACIFYLGFRKLKGYTMK